MLPAEQLPNKCCCCQLFKASNREGQKPYSNLAPGLEGAFCSFLQRAEGKLSCLSFRGDCLVPRKPGGCEGGTCWAAVPLPWHPGMMKLNVKCNFENDRRHSYTHTPNCHRLKTFISSKIIFMGHNFCYKIFSPLSGTHETAPLLIGLLFPVQSPDPLELVIHTSPAARGRH